MNFQKYIIHFSTLFETIFTFSRLISAENAHDYYNFSDDNLTLNGPLLQSTPGTPAATVAQQGLSKFLTLHPM